MHCNRASSQATLKQLIGKNRQLRRVSKTQKNDDIASLAFSLFLIPSAGLTAFNHCREQYDAT